MSVNVLAKDEHKDEVLNCGCQINKFSMSIVYCKSHNKNNPPK